MNGKFFLDTNIIVYSLDNRAPEKKARAIDLLDEALHTGNGMISWQVVQEFISLAMRKFRDQFEPDDLSIFLQRILAPLYMVHPDFSLYVSAIDLHRKTGYPYYDSLIIASAIRGDCSLLYSEDLRHNQRIGAVTIINPFQ